MLFRHWGTAVEEPDKFDAIEIALEGEPDEPDGDSVLASGLNGDGCSVGIMSMSEVEIPRAGEIIARRFTHLKRDERGYLGLKLNRKRRFSWKKGVRAGRGFVWTSREAGHGVVKMEDGPVDKSPSSISTEDRGAVVGDSERDFSNELPSTLMASLVSLACPW